jgi:hypothetical protein
VINFTELPVASLLVDVRNARLKDPQATPQAAILALAKQQGPKLLELARSIAATGRLDPLTVMAVVASTENPGEYVVLEGNRRLVTLLGLETPGLIAAAFNPAGQRELQKLSQRYTANPITSVRCAVFDTEDEAVEWIDLRHTGQSGGKGLVEWGADEKDRFKARHGGTSRSPAGQIIDFVEGLGTLSPAAQSSGAGIITNLQRMLSSRQIRAALGIDVVAGRVVMHYPSKEVAKSLTRVVEELKLGMTNVGDIYNASHREEYARKFDDAFRPSQNTRLATPVALGATTPPSSPPRKKTPKKQTPAKPPTPRDTLIPAECVLTIAPTRLNLIYHELRRLNVADFANACSVLLRVFVELSVDHYIKVNSVPLTAAKGDINLAYKMKQAGEHLRNQGAIDQSLLVAIRKIADSSRILAAATVTFNQYVHNAYVHPQPIDLRAAWDEMQPFMEALWP